jgi:hypothetical protein
MFHETDAHLVLFSSFASSRRIASFARGERAAHNGKSYLLSIKAAHNTGLSIFGFIKVLIFGVNFFENTPKKEPPKADFSARTPSDGVLPVRHKG